LRRNDNTIAMADLMNQREQYSESRLHLQWWLPVVFALLVFVSSKTVAQFGTIQVRNGNQTLNITTGTAGGTMTSVVNTNSQLRYWRKAQVAKITVRTTCPGQSFSLAVVATGVTRGVAAPQVDLVNGMLAVDFITNIPRTGFTSATPTLRYTASATFAQGNSAELGNDVHTVTYTLQVQ
jgi:hypothetical protein